MFRTIRTAVSMAAIALALSACGPGNSEGVVAEAPTTTDTPIPEESAAETACVHPIEDDDSCIVVSSVNGEITAVEPYPAGMDNELHLACVYQDHDGACDVLAFVGPGDGIGNWLSQTLTDALVQDCAALTGVDRDLACAELDARS